MKFLVIILLSIALYGNTSDTYAWDSTAAKFMPLQVGNVWVYFSEYHLPYPYNGGSGLIKYKITGVIDSLNTKYYKFTETRYIISGNGGCSIPFFDFLRIDSSSMNLYEPVPSCTAFENLIDSLNSRINDCTYCYSVLRKKCFDTAYYSIFNQLIPVKKFTNERGNTNTFYLKNIGLNKYTWYELMNSCQDTLRGCVINGVLFGDTSTLVGINQLNTELPNEFSLSQNYPNPFNPLTKIKFDISGTSMVQIVLSVYDILGREIAVLVNQQLEPGSYEADWDASAYPSGVYYYKLESASFSETKKMVLIK